MTFKRRLIGLTLCAMLAKAARAGAQVKVSLGCSQGIPDCGSLRFFLNVVGGTPIDQLFITLLTPPEHFTAGPVSTEGVYSAEDSFGPFGGFTTISNGGATVAINYLDNGFPFQALDGDMGTLDLEAAGFTNTNGLNYTVSGVLDDGGTFTVSTTPEPSTIFLMATGLLGVGVVRRKRRKLRIV